MTEDQKFFRSRNSPLILAIGHFCTNQKSGAQSPLLLEASASMAHVIRLQTLPKGCC